MTAEERLGRTARVLAFALAANLVQAAAKALYGWRSDSVAVIADALHSLLDGGSSIVGLIAVRAAARPADSDHPYGHRKFEALASVGIGVFILAGLAGMARTVVARLVDPREPDVGAGGPALLLGLMAIGAVVSWVENREGRRLRSPVLLADARHTLSDLFAGASVLAGLVGAAVGFPLADALAGVVVLGVLAPVAWRVVRPSIAVLSDEARLDPQAIAAAAAQVAAVRRTRAIRSRGPDDEIRMDLAVMVDPVLSVREAHTVAHAVERAIRGRFPGVVEVVVHVEPDE